MTKRNFVSRQRLRASVKANALRLAVSPLSVSVGHLFDEQIREQPHASTLVIRHLARPLEDSSRIDDLASSAVSRPVVDTLDRVRSTVSRSFSKHAVDTCIAQDRILTARAARDNRDIAALGMAGDEHQATIEKPVSEQPIITGQLESWASRAFEKTLSNRLVAMDALSMDGGAAPQALAEAGLTSDAAFASLLTANVDVVGSAGSHFSASIARAVYEGQSYVSADYFHEDYVVGTARAPSVTDSVALKMQSYVRGDYFASDYVVGTQQFM